MRSIVLLLVVLSAALAANAQQFTRQDTLRGTLTADRNWWDVTYYDLHVKVSLADSSLSGKNIIHYRVLKPYKTMQIDLQQPMQIDSVVQAGKSLKFRRDGNAFFITMQAAQVAGKINQLTVYYHGLPRKAIRAPWDGGVQWSLDSLNRPWIATACQNLGASVWWPNKDHQTEEADSTNITVTVPSDLTNVSNGRLRSRKDNGDGTTTFNWFVSNPINNYDVSLNIAHYTEFTDSFTGEKGKLDMSFWVLDYNLDRAKKHFEVVKPMMKCFEHWFGPYPFYEDSYKLVETPHLGMEHQSAVAYGNKYKMGYLGRDLSGSGWGLKWDFIIIHETGHEWFGNNITTKDIADMWVHEGFTNYSETIFTQCADGLQAANEYNRGSRRNVQNDIPIIGKYGVNNEGSGDMYPKASAMIHNIRQIINDDEKFRQILRGLNKKFYHQTVTGRQVQQYINNATGKNFDKVYEQYLTTIVIPELEYKIENGVLSYRWSNSVKGFNMPIKVTLSDGQYSFIYPLQSWKTTKLQLSDPSKFAIDPNFYIKVKKS
ncbi:M1 family metallopeptidase [Chitinophaga horti]|uniref:M1 family metallopeptidase n=1 Tax=Chitinophaga horti TaxID=2920382 RepID=A0ABY6J9Y5_9BACT|nr:M1 family metallopeptidase [Chitinophaga horti]UYQ95111.1 M1 family metallopeptidase [Chitinophaga horti]